MKIYLRNVTVILFIILSISCVPAKEISCAPDFNLQDIHGDTVSLGSYKSKQPVILFFWTTWCPYCRKELKLLNDKHPELKKDGTELLAVNIGEPAYKVDNFIKSYSLTFKVLLDKDTNVAHSYRILGVPTYVLIDKKGTVRLESHHFPQEKYKELTLE